MTEGKILLAGLVAAVMLTAIGGTAASAAPSWSKGGVMIAADETQPAGAKDDKSSDSAKMGKEEGTHTGANQGAKPENDTDKVDQPERRNSTTGN